MKLISFCLIGVLALSLTACGGTEQDPLDSLPPEVQNGQLPSKPKPPKEKPMASDVLRIDGADFFVFRENMEQEIAIRARSTFENVTYKVEITNLDQFKGATTEAVDGDAAKDTQAEVSFKWTPAKGLVFADVVTYTLDTIVYTTNLEENYSFKKSFNIFIYKETFNVPQILSMEPVLGAVKEGATAQFKVKVKDLDGTPTTMPNLMALTDYTQKNGAPYLSWDPPVQDPNNADNWLFTVKINLANVEITTGADTAEFSIAAVSAAGKKSNPSKGSFNVWSSITPPITSWLDVVEFKVGQSNHFDFSILDPRGEGKLSTSFLTSCATLPGAPACNCVLKVGVSGKANTLAACSIDWAVPSDISVQEQQIVYNAQNKSTLTGDAETKNVNFSGKIKLVP